MKITNPRKLTSQYDEPRYIDELKRTSDWSKIVETAVKVGNEWKNDRQRHRLLTKKVMEKVINKKVL